MEHFEFFGEDYLKSFMPEKVELTFYKKGMYKEEAFYKIKKSGIEFIFVIDHLNNNVHTNDYTKEHIMESIASIELSEDFIEFLNHKNRLILLVEKEKAFRNWVEKKKLYGYYFNTFVFLIIWFIIANLANLVVSGLYRTFFYSFAIKYTILPIIIVYIFTKLHILFLTYYVKRKVRL
jgi:hypothetical protein